MGEVHISTGMTTKDEIEKIVKFWEEGKGDAKNRVVLYNCTSGYPVPFEDVCLVDIRLLQQSMPTESRPSASRGTTWASPSTWRPTPELQADGYLGPREGDARKAQVGRV